MVNILPQSLSRTRSPQFKIDFHDRSPSAPSIADRQWQLMGLAVPVNLLDRVSF